MKRTAIVLILIVSVSSFLVIAQAKPSRTIEKRVFIHKLKPEGRGKSDKNNDKAWYKYSGVHWASEDLPLAYVVDPSGSGLDPQQVLDVITASFEAWDIETETSELFSEGALGTTTAGVLDSVNSISFGDYPSDGVIAVTYYWFWSDTGEMVEADTLFDLDYLWSIAEGGVSGTMDLQNIATHEFGHWLVLNDLYKKPAQHQTMYGYGAYAETKKRTLESGDIAGLETIYGP